MNRAQLLWLQTNIAVGGALFWWFPPSLPQAPTAIGLSMLWGSLCFASIYLESLEDWSHRCSAFLSFLFATVECLLGGIGLGDKPGLFWLGVCHGLAFVLAVVGRYRSRARRRPRSSFEQLAQQLKEQESALH